MPVNSQKHGIYYNIVSDESSVECKWIRPHACGQQIGVSICVAPNIFCYNLIEQV